MFIAVLRLLRGFAADMPRAQGGAYSAIFICLFFIRRRFDACRL